jgi:Uma2 family endonuclease
MAMPAETTEWTAEMARALPDDGNRYEVLDGELFVTPAPSRHHQRALKRLYDSLNPYVVKHSIGEMLWSPSDIEFSPRRLVQPDVFVAPAGPGIPSSTWRDISALILAIEVLSPSTARADRSQKRTIYQDQRVPEYWIVDLDARVVERWRPDDERPEVLADTLLWQPRADAAPLSIALPEFFAAVMD